MSTAAAVFAPLFAQVALVFVLLFWMGWLRVRDVRGHAVKMGDIALGERAWPKQTQQAANCFSNQFEAPVLFYVLTGLQWVLGAFDEISVAMAWAFVISRYAHAAEFVGRNNGSVRAGRYGIGVMVLFGSWVLFAVRVFSS